MNIHTFNLVADLRQICDSLLMMNIHTYNFRKSKREGCSKHKDCNDPHILDQSFTSIPKRGKIKGENILYYSSCPIHKKYWEITFFPQLLSTIAWTATVGIYFPFHHSLVITVIKNVSNKNIHIAVKALYRVYMYL